MLPHCLHHARHMMRYTLDHELLLHMFHFIILTQDYFGFICPKNLIPELESPFILFFILFKFDVFFQSFYTLF